MSLRLGLIGAGHWGRRMIRTVADMPEARLARVASSNPQTRALVGDGCELVSDWREVATAKDLDAVLIATPPGEHYAAAKAAIDAGIAVLIEKPLTLDPAQAAEIVELAERRKAVAWVDHIHLFNPAYVELKRRLPAIAPVRAILSEGGNLGPFKPAAPPLWDYGAHDVSLALDLIGEPPQSLSARLEREQPAPEAGLVARLTLRFARGITAEIRVGNLLDKKTRRLEVRGERGDLVFDDSEGARLWHDGTEAVVDATPPLKLVLEAFLDSARRRDPDPRLLRLGSQVVSLLAEAESSLRRQY